MLWAMGNIRLLALAAVVGFCFGRAPAVLAVGIAIQPERLRLVAAWGQATAGEIVVRNPALQPAMYQLASALPTTQLQIQPSSFRLDPGGSQLVVVAYRARHLARRQAALDVLARPLATTGIGVASGVRYPLTLITTVRWWPVVVRGLLLAGLLAFAAWAMRRRLVVGV